jgi:hypothetical protein
VAFAAEQPHHYRVLFERFRPAGAATITGSWTVEQMLGAEAFAILLGSPGSKPRRKASMGPAKGGRRTPGCERPMCDRCLSFIMVCGGFPVFEATWRDLCRKQSRPRIAGAGWRSERC